MNIFTPCLHSFILSTKKTTTTKPSPQPKILLLPNHHHPKKSKTLVFIYILYIYTPLIYQPPFLEREICLCKITIPLFYCTDSTQNTQTHTKHFVPLSLSLLSSYHSFIFDTTHETSWIRNTTIEFSTTKIHTRIFFLPSF